MTRRFIIGIIFTVAALLKLASMWNIVHMEWLWKQPWTEYIGPALLLYIGVHLIIYGFGNDQWLERPVPFDENGKRIYCAVRFGGDQYVYHGEEFKGAHLDTFCGGIRLDLREANLREDEEIDIHTFMGSVELIVPDKVNIISKSRNFIGSIRNNTTSHTTPNVPCLHIVASNFFGGVVIKNQMA